MQYTSHYHSPLGEILLAGDDTGLTGLWFTDQRYFAYHLDPDHEEKEIPLFQSVKEWLDGYFSGQKPLFTPPLHIGGTSFQRDVENILCTIPYGQTLTYGEIAMQVAMKRGKEHMSARAVGVAVGHNPISIIIPCHRVVGADGNLTGYAGGIERKKRLLALEGVELSRFFVPKKGTAL